MCFGVAKNRIGPVGRRVLRARAMLRAIINKSAANSWPLRCSGCRCRCRCRCFRGRSRIHLRFCAAAAAAAVRYARPPRRTMTAFATTRTHAKKSSAIIVTASRKMTTPSLGPPTPTPTPSDTSARNATLRNVASRNVRAHVTPQRNATRNTMRTAALLPVFDYLKEYSCVAYGAVVSRLREHRCNARTSSADAANAAIC